MENPIGTVRRLLVYFTWVEYSTFNKNTFGMEQDRAPAPHHRRCRLNYRCGSLEDTKIK